MLRPETAFRPGGWPGALARMLAFVAVLVVLAVLFGALWSLLPVPAGEAATLAGTAVLAAAALAAGALLIRGLDGRSPSALGIGLSRETLRHTVMGVVIGGGALAVAAAALLLTGSLRYATAPGTAVAWLGVVSGQATLFAIAALAEEALFRGYAFQVLARAAGPAAAIVTSSALFALAHGANPEVGVFALLNIFLAGVLLAVAYLRTLSLWFATALHLGWNWTMATLFDLPVSGIQDFDTPLYDAVVGGPEWWSGGMFGPEGGLVGTIGFACALLAVLRWRRLGPDPRIAGAGALVLDRERGYA
ncbi:MAG TPA: CPBP family intramembrane glutamic endopeptidase [Longimicrobiales bacterium]|nr:CPBP family intramembrane glutamic endopeptidase [Longimicrobiales bacterium]